MDIIVLLDHHVAGYHDRLLAAWQQTGWHELINLRLVQLAEFGLTENAPDDEIWRLCQCEQLYLLTNNRNRKGTKSLQATMESEATADTLPVITLSDIKKLHSADYCRRVADGMGELFLYAESQRGNDRVFVP
jgi:hypothetical protein